MEGLIVYFAPQPTNAAPLGMTLSNAVLSVLVLVSLGLSLLAVALLLPGAVRERLGAEPDDRGKRDERRGRQHEHPD